jgi:hypothetical protein
LRKVSNLKVGVDRFKEVITRIHAHGMAVSASIIFGNDRDTLDTFEQLKSFSTDSELDSVVYTILTPLPGTDLWDRLEAEGRLWDLPLPESYAHFDAHHVTFLPGRVTAGELLAANREAVQQATNIPALVSGMWQTWRRTSSALAALAAFQNNRWARNNSRSSTNRLWS